MLWTSNMLANSVKKCRSVRFDGEVRSGLDECCAHIGNAAAPRSDEQQQDFLIRVRDPLHATIRCQQC